MRSIKCFLLVLLLTLTGLAAFAAPLLQAGDRMVFLGDSITQQQIYTRYVMNYFALRYPGVNIAFRNAGWGGDTAPGGLGRLQRDVLNLKPTVVSICFGMNDGHYSKFDQPSCDRYLTSMTGLVAKLKEVGVKVILLTPGCVDTDKRPSAKGDDWTYNDTLAKYGDGVKELATKENQPFYNLHALMLDVQTKAKAENPQFTMIPDGVHPTNAGHAIMAYALLKALGCDEQASGLEIDAVKSVSKPDRCRVSDLKVADTTLTFTRTDKALPTCFDPDVAQVTKYFPLMDELNQYQFKVTGLKAGNWKLTVDNIEVGTFSDTELAAGVNLATKPGPWQVLGKQVNTDSLAAESLYFTTWRSFSLNAVPKEAEPELKALLDKLNGLLDTQEKTRQLEAAEHPWKWSLTLAAK